MKDSTAVRFTRLVMAQTHIVFLPLCDVFLAQLSSWSGALSTRLLGLHWPGGPVCFMLPWQRRKRAPCPSHRCSLSDDLEDPHTHTSVRKHTLASVCWHLTSRIDYTHKRRVCSELTDLCFRVMLLLTKSWLHWLGIVSFITTEWKSWEEHHVFTYSAYLFVYSPC